jgi:hypothetical protein
MKKAVFVLRASFAIGISSAALANNGYRGDGTGSGYGNGCDCGKGSG